MIEKFNFYDIYGYFVPGAVFLATLWLPVGVVKGIWPPNSWSSALIAAAIAYILGHLLQNVATNAIPSRRTGGKQRYPSDRIFDPAEKELPYGVKRKIAQLVESQFGLDLQISDQGDKEIDKIRNNAFRLARQVLIQGEAVSYAEQFQGMYAITRGLFAVFALAAPYWLGWFFAAQAARLLARIAMLIVATAVPYLIGTSRLRDVISNEDNRYAFEIAYALGLIVMFFAIGYVAGIHYRVSWHAGSILAFLAGCATLACLRFKGAYDYFAGLFASTVWRDYLAYNVKSETTRNLPSE